MRFNVPLIILIGLSLYSSLAGAAEAALKPDPATWVICAPAKAHASYRHAAEELARYIKQMTGIDVPIVNDHQPTTQKVCFLIGGPDVNAITRTLIDKLDLPAPEGFILRSINKNNTDYVILAGDRGRSTLYAVYTYLRQLCDCGFFRDGDFIPQRDALPITGINLIDAPKFSMRESGVFMFHYGPQEKYSATWLWDNWKRHIDWSIKTGSNHYALWYIGGSFFWGDAFYRAFPECDANLDSGSLLSPKDRLKLSKQVVDYLREIDMGITYGVSFGAVNSSFAKAHPNLKYAGPLGFHGQAVNLNIEEPQIVPLMKKLWKTVLDEFGPADYYFIQYAHEQKRSDERYKAYDEAVKLFRELDPKAKFMIWTWDIDYAAEEKDPQKRFDMFLQRAPKDVLVHEQSYNFRGIKAAGTENVFQRPWYHVNRFGTYENGDRLMDRGATGGVINQALVVEQKIPNGAIGAHIYNEMDLGNIMVEQISKDSAWNASRTREQWTNGQWLQRYVLERYGKSSQQDMLEAINIRLDTNCTGLLDIDLKGVLADKPFTQRSAEMQKALAAALKQRQANEKNPLYIADLYDMTTQFMTRCAVEKLRVLLAASTKAPQRQIDKALNDCQRTIDLLDDLSASLDRDKLSATIDRIAAIPNSEPVSKMEPFLVTSHYSILSYEKWHDHYARPYRAILDAIRQQKSPEDAKQITALAAAARLKDPHDIVQLGRIHKPKQSTLDLLEMIQKESLLKEAQSPAN